MVAHPHRAFAVCLVAVFMTLVDITAVYVAFPSLMAQLPASAEQAQWAATVYVLGFGMVSVLGGRLGDEWGRGPVVLGGTIGFAMASVGAGLAPNAWVFIGMRLLQGLAGG